MERSVGAKLGGAFVVGGLIAVCTQVIMLVMSKVAPEPGLVAPLSLVVLGIIGMVLVLTGKYQKLNEIGGFGAGIMFCGLVDAVAGVFVGATMEAKGNKGAGFKAAAIFALSILGTLIVVGTILGLLLAHTPGVLQAASEEAANAYDPGLLVFLWAFLMGGLISIEGEALLNFTPIPLPAVILINAALGMALAIFGVSSMLEVITGAGLCATVVDAGAGAVLGGAVIILAGTPLRLIILVLVMVIVVAMGLVCGNILANRAKT
jgi:hypothetical protein